MTSESISIIRGADGPTSIFLSGSKMTPKQIIQKWFFTLKKKCIAKSLRADPHTIEQVTAYAKSKWGYTEISKNSREYQMEYAWLRASFIIQYQPQLLGKWKDIPTLKGQDEQSIKQFLAFSEQRQKAAEKVPAELFDIELRILRLHKNDFESQLLFEKKYGYISGSASGFKKELKQYRSIFRDISRYYGVTQADIDNRSKRYEDLLTTLAIK